MIQKEWWIAWMRLETHTSPATADKKKDLRSQGNGDVIVSFRSPDVAVPIYRALSEALGVRHRFIISTPLAWKGREHGRDLAKEALEVFQRRRRMGSRRPLQGLRKWRYLTVMAMKYAGLRKSLQRLHPTAVFVWNAERGRGRALASAARDLAIPTLVFEHAPIPGCLTVDQRGVNAKAAISRDPQFYRDWAAKAHPTTNWREAGNSLVARKPKRSLPGAPVRLPENYIFLPLQVATDTQILLNGRWVPSIREMLLAAIRQIPRLPEGWALVVKEHPSCRIKNAAVLTQHVDTSGLIVSTIEDTFDLVRGSRGVLTLNSSVGLQSFFFDKPVAVLGDAFYRQSGLVETADSESELGDLFARADGWTFDASLRDAFMSWLCAEYYVPIDEKNPTEISDRAVAMIRNKLRQAKVGLAA